MHVVQILYIYITQQLEVHLKGSCIMIINLSTIFLNNESHIHSVYGKVRREARTNEKHATCKYHVLDTNIPSTIVTHSCLSF